MSIKLNSILIYCMYGMIVIDMITGAILIENPDASITPGLIYKLLLLSLLYYYLPRLGVKVVIANTLLIFTTILASLFTGFFSISSNIIAVTKLLMFVTFFHYLMYLLKKEAINTKTIYHIALFTFSVIVLNQFLGFLGFGKPTYLLYGVPVGTSGFFFEHNATGIVLTIATALIYLYIRNKHPLRRIFLFLGFSLAIGFSFATKTAILGTLIIFFLGVFEKKRNYLPFAIGLFAIVVITNWEVIQESGQVAKVIDDLNKNSTEGMLSGRVERLSKSIDDYVLRFSVTEKLIGIGNYRIINDPIVGETAETDYIDILKMSGLIGFCIVFIPFIVATINSAYLYRKYRLADFALVFFLNIVFLIISSTAGHLFTSGSVNFYLALFNIYPYFSASKETIGLLNSQVKPISN